MTAKRIVVKGRVQGVFFRVHAKQKADVLELRGWVKNCEDGCVELHVQGSPEKVLEMEKWCREGPPAAQVEHMVSTDAHVGKYDDFSIKD